MWVSFLMVLALAIDGCTAEAPREGAVTSSIRGNHAPVVREATITPAPLTLDSPISVHVTADDADRDPLTFAYKWVVNGHPLEGQTGALLPPQLLKQGDKVSVEILPDDGKAKGAIYRSPAVTVLNTPPIISSLLVSPQPGVPGDQLEAKIEATDPDADPIHIVFRWWRNGAVVKEGEEPTLDTNGFSNTDQVVVEAIARDQKAAGKSMKSGRLFTSNSRPAITSTPTVPSAGTPFEYRVQAVDPEGDQLSYRLETAPAGMVIDETTGHIRWPTAQAPAGTHHVRVVVEDPGGGRAFQEFDLNILSPPSSSPNGT
ncbi:MAG: Ig domain-containing protein [Nitrospira sp.]|nr:Ig domain-containing protein [Nitrospira sp.]